MWAGRSNESGEVAGLKESSGDVTESEQTASFKWKIIVGTGVGAVVTNADRLLKILRPDVVASGIVGFFRWMVVRNPLAAIVAGTVGWLAKNLGRHAENHGWVAENIGRVAENHGRLADNLWLFVVVFGVLFLVYIIVIAVDLHLRRQQQRAP